MTNYGTGPSLPIVDPGDLQLVGWGAMTLDDGSLLVAVDGTPFGIKIAPGGSLEWTGNGVMYGEGVTFLGPMKPPAVPENGSPG